MTLTSNAKAAARELARTWSKTPTVHRHWDENEKHSVDIASCIDSPFDGRISVGTVTLSNHDLGLGSLRVELIGAFPSSFEDAANVAATCAFNAFKDGVPTRPDAIHENVLSLYTPSTALPHVLLADPFLWPDGPETLQERDLTIAWLMIVPISDNERRFSSANGPAALTSLLEQQHVDILDLNRKSAV